MLKIDKYENAVKAKTKLKKIRFKTQQQILFTVFKLEITININVSYQTRKCFVRATIIVYI